jgi:hypothetical protein
MVNGDSDWLACTDPDVLLLAAPGSVTRRKWLLLACACARRAWHLVPDVASDALSRLEAVAVADSSLGDHGAVSRALTAVRFRLADAANAQTGKNHRIAERLGTAYRRLVFHIACAARLANAGARARSRPTRRIKRMKIEERRYQRQLIRDVFGNPFRPFFLDPYWLTANDGAVHALASAIDAGQDFRRLPILADALEDAGCTDESILAHCRSGGTHVRGCWVVDLVLGRS